MNKLDAAKVKNETMESQSKIKNGFSWVILVIIVPLLVAVVAIGGALQFVGVDVLGSTMHLLGLQKTTATSATKTPLSTARAQLSIARSENTALKSQVQRLQSQLTSEKQTENALQSKINQLQSQITPQVNAVNKAKKEADYVRSMDPTQAASVLEKMTNSDAAAIIAEMNPSDASGILGAMTPAEAGNIMSIAAQIAASSTSASK